MSRKQQTNSLDRFRKHSPRLVLEEYDACEVPAGCGGVVLRWRNPYAAQPYHLYAWVAKGEWTALIDGQPLETTRADLAPGPHVLAFTLADADRAAALLAVAFRYVPHDGTRDLHTDAPHVRDVLSAGDGNWLATTDAPPDGWATVDAKVSGWARLVVAATPQLNGYAEGQYQLEHALWLGGRCLGLSGGKGRGPVWVRRRFTVLQPD